MIGDLVLEFNRNSLASRSICTSINGSRKIRQKDVRNSLTLWFYRWQFGISPMNRYPIHIYGQGTRLVLSLKNYDFRWSSFKWSVSRVNADWIQGLGRLSWLKSGLILTDGWSKWGLMPAFRLVSVWLLLYGWGSPNFSSERCWSAQRSWLPSSILVLIVAGAGGGGGISLMMWHRLVARVPGGWGGGVRGIFFIFFTKRRGILSPSACDLCSISVLGYFCMNILKKKFFFFLKEYFKKMLICFFA